MRSAKEIMESLEIAKGLCEGKTNESWNARKAGRVMAELIAHFKKKEIEEQYDRVQIIATVVISKEETTSWCQHWKVELLTGLIK